MTAVPPTTLLIREGVEGAFQPLKGNDGRAALCPAHCPAGKGEFQPLKGNDGRAAIV